MNETAQDEAVESIREQWPVDLSPDQSVENKQYE